MPEIKIDTASTWGQSYLNNMHPRLNGDLIKTPDNLIENGDLLDLDANGHPIGIEIGEVESPDGRVVLCGRSPGSASVQNTSPLPITQQTYVQDFGPIVGAPAASPETAALLPRPDAPIVKVVPAPLFGYPQSTEEKPFALAFGWEVDGTHTQPGPVTFFQIGQGQGMRVTLPESVPQGVTGIDLYLPEPGRTSQFNPGKLYRQRTLPVGRYRASTYDLTGPFRRDFPEGTRNETKLREPVAPHVWRGFAQNAVPGDYQVAIQYRTNFGTTPVGNLSSAYTIRGDRSALVVKPRDVPGAATGYRVLVYTNSRWYVAVDTYYGGAESFRPLSGEFATMTVGGSLGNESATTDAEGNEIPAPPPSRYTLSETTPERIDTSGVPHPDTAPAVPTTIGRAVPVGELTFRVADTLRGLMSVASEPVTITVAEGEMAVVELRNPTNLVSNSRYAETTSDGKPLGHTVTTSNDVRTDVEADGLAIKTRSALSSTIDATVTSPVKVDPTQDAIHETRLVVSEPISGSKVGSVRTVIQQISSTGSVLASNTVSTSSASGVYAHSVQMLSVGSTVSAASTVSATQVVYVSNAVSYVRVSQQLVVSGTSGVNISVKIKEHIFQRFRHRWRRKRKRSRKRSTTAPVPVQPLPPSPPGGVTIVEPSPEPPIPGETITLPDPDRLRVAGTDIETVNFDTGALPAGWTQNVGTGATLTVEAAAALDGGFGMRATKAAATTAPTNAFIRKAHSLPNSHFEGFSSRFRPNGALPAGTLTMNEMRTSDGRSFGWLEMNAALEQKRITIDSPPIADGYITIGLEGANYNIHANARKQIETFDFTAGSTSEGTMTLNLNGVAHGIRVGGQVAIWKLVITAGQTQPSDDLRITLNGVNFRLNDIPIADAAGVATWIRGFAFPGWITGGTGNEVVFTADTKGARNGSYDYNRIDSTVQAYMEEVQRGTSASTASEVATLVRTQTYSGWNVSGSGTQAVFTATTLGARTAATFDAGGTGVTATVTNTQAGVQDTIDELAARVRGTAFTGWTTGGTGGAVDLTATTAGDRAGGTLTTEGTGVKATLATIQPGGNGDILACYRDANEAIQKRKIIGNITLTDPLSVDMAVHGLGTDDATIYTWGSTGTNPKSLLARWEGVDLTGYSASTVDLGVTSESAASMTWDVFIDTVRITDRGETWFREHNSDGKRINQLTGFFLPSQPVRQDLLVRSLRIPVLPGFAYRFGVVARFENLPTNPAPKPLYAEAIKLDGTVVAIGDLVTNGAPNETGVSGTMGWAEYTPNAITVPADCYEIRIRSRDISSGSFYLQELVFSKGTAVKRTSLYATVGSFRTRFHRDAAHRPHGLPLERERVFLGTRVEAPAGATSTVTYRSGSYVDPLNPLAGVSWGSGFLADPTQVPDLPIVEIDGSFTTDGTDTVVVSSGSPSMEYLVRFAGNPVPTLLRPDRSELPGGVILDGYEEWSRRPRVNVSPQYSGRVRRQRVAAPVGYQQPCQVFCFSPQAKRYIEEEWGPPNELQIEALGWLLSVKLTEQPNLESNQQSRRRLPDGSNYAVYGGELAYMEVVDARRFSGSP